jgi:hypothetical protein
MDNLLSTWIDHARDIDGTLNTIEENARKASKSWTSSSRSPLSFFANKADKSGQANPL